jgi:hypothetical protein
MQAAFTAYISDVQGQVFPAQEHTVEMPEDEWEEFLKAEAGASEK